MAGSIFFFYFLLILDMGVQITYQRLNKKLKNNIFAER